MKQDIKQVVSTLQQGGVVVLPTDTVYGLAVVPTDATAVKKIYTLKERPMSMFLPIMVAHIGQLEELGVDINEPARKLLKSSLVPGGITFVLGFRPEAKKPEWLATRDEIAVRIPDNAFLLEVLEQTGPLLITSANKHGSTHIPNTVVDILAELHGNPDYIVEGGKGKDLPSTIINCRYTPPLIERLGVIPEETITTILNGN